MRYLIMKGRRRKRRLIKANLEVHSTRIADMALAIEGDIRAIDKMIHRFLSEETGVGLRALSNISDMLSGI
jgi:hypothetical protein